MSEKLSALIDNELDDLERARVLKDLGGDEALNELWSRYHIIGLAMRREVVVPTAGLADRVSVRLREESLPAVDAHEPQHRTPALRSASRFAIAASVAGVLLVGGLVVAVYDWTRGGAPAGVVEPQIAAVDDATRWEGADPKTEDALNALLVEHSEFTSASGMNGLTAYTKFVAYDSP